MKIYDLLPKVELHLHLDGSLNIDSVKKRYNLSDDDIKKMMIADDKCTNLNDYLTKFDYPISIMQTKEELEFVTIELLNNLKNQNVIYAEIRFAPQFHTKKGLSQDEVVATILDAKNKVDIKCNFILCFMRGDNNDDLNYETLEVAKKYYGKGVCAVDLAGAEALFKTENYETLFNKVKEYNLAYTIHAGEADGANSIKSAIKFGTKRLGHGVRCIEDEEVLRYIIDNKIFLEVCPTSNIQTCICDSYKTHPISRLYKEGALVTINTDNMTVSNTTLANEYEKLVLNTDLTIKDIIKMNINSIKASFLSLDEKKELLNDYMNLGKGLSR